MRNLVAFLFCCCFQFIWTQELTYHFVDDIKFMRQDKHGFIYLISNNSICLFDGKEVHSSCLYTEEQINDALIHTEGEYYVAIGNRFLKYDNQIIKEEYILDDLITRLQFHENDILIGTLGKGIFSYSINSNTISTLGIKGYINDIAKLGSHSYVISDTELFKIDHNLKPIKRLVLTELLPKQILAYGNNNLAILMNNGKVIFLNTELEILSTYQSNTFKPNELEGKNGLLFAIDDNFLKQWDNDEFIELKKGTFEHLSLVQSLLFTSYKDKIESVNILSSSYPIDRTFSIFNENNQFWLGREGKISLFENGEITKNIAFPELYKNSYVSSLIVHNQMIYAGTMGNGILIFDSNTGKYLNSFKKLEDKLNEQNIIKLHYIDNNLWVGFLNGLKVYNLDNQLLLRDYTDLLKNNYLYTFYAKNSSDFFLGTSDDGLIHVKNNEPKYYFKGSSVYSIVETPYGIIFSVEGKGVYLLKDDDVTNLSDQYFFRSNNIYNITYVDDNILLSHDDGVDILDFKNQRVNYISNESLSEPNLNSSAYSSSNTLVGFENGIIKFSNNLLNEVNNKELVLYPPLLFDDKVEKSKTNFEYDENVWSFLFESQNYYAPNQRYYKYRLRPLEEQWKSTTQEKVTYYNLTSGDYNFEVSGGGHRNFRPIQIKNYEFTIAKPFWMMYWFWILSLLLLIGIIFGIIKYREQQVIKKEQLKSFEIQYEYQRIKDQINPHFLFNSFNSLIGIVEENPNKATKVLEKLSSMFRAILKHEKSEIISLHEELELAKQYFEIHKIRYQDLIQLDIKSIEEAHQKFVIPFSLQLLIENAIKHNIINKRSKLTITIKEDSGYLIVSNNLNKKNKNVLSLGLGLENLIKRHEMILNKKPIIEEELKHFTVRIPYIYE